MDPLSVQQIDCPITTSGDSVVPLTNGSISMSAGPNILPLFIRTAIENGDRLDVLSFANSLQAVSTTDVVYRIAKKMRYQALLVFMDQLPDAIIARCLTYIGLLDYIHIIPQICKRFKALGSLPSSLPLFLLPVNYQSGSCHVSLVIDAISPYSLIRWCGEKPRTGKTVLSDRVNDFVIKRLFNTISGTTSVMESLRISSAYFGFLISTVSSKSSGKNGSTSAPSPIFPNLKQITVEWKPRDLSHYMLMRLLVDLVAQHAPLMHSIDIYTHHVSLTDHTTVISVQNQLSSQFLLASSMAVSFDLNLVLLARYNHGYGRALKWNGSLPSHCPDCNLLCYGYVCSSKGPCRNPLMAGRCNSCMDRYATKVCKSCQRRFHNFDAKICTAVGEPCSLYDHYCDHCAGGSLRST